MAKDPSGGKDFAKEAGSQIEYDTKKLKNTGKKRKRIGDFNFNNGYSFFRCRFF